MHYLAWLHATKHMTDMERGTFFHGLGEDSQTELMDSFAKSARVNRRGNISNRFKGIGR